MGSQGGIGNGTVDGNHSQEPKSNLLARQGSIYSLTLDEVQNHLGGLGKALSSMNLDELLKTVWNAEANKGIEGMDFGVQQHGQIPSALNQLGVNLSRDLSKKTVDEVWQDIQQGQKGNSLDKKSRERQPTLGEMTLEDFLVKAGVVAEPVPKNNPGSGLAIDPLSSMQQQNVQQQAQWMHYQIPSIHQPPPQQHNMMSAYMPGNSVQQPLPMGSNSMMDAAFSENQMSMSPSTLMGTLSDTQMPGRKRLASGDVIEKTVERRQKRMIKNRESAARSRARKQAYTHELENKVSRLEEENERLKKQREVERALPVLPLPEPKYQLRRTSSF